MAYSVYISDIQQSHFIIMKYSLLIFKFVTVNYKSWHLRNIAMCIPSDVAPVVLGFSYEVHYALCLSMLSIVGLVTNTIIIHYNH